MPRPCSSFWCISLQTQIGTICVSVAVATSVNLLFLGHLISRIRLSGINVSRKVSFLRLVNTRGHRSFLPDRLCLCDLRLIFIPSAKDKGWRTDLYKVSIPRNVKGTVRAAATPLMEISRARGFFVHVAVMFPLLEPANTESLVPSRQRGRAASGSTQLLRTELLRRGAGGSSFV
jgi:hypothetical protein